MDHSTLRAAVKGLGQTGPEDLKWTEAELFPGKVYEAQASR